MVCLRTKSVFSLAMGVLSGFSSAMLPNVAKMCSQTNRQIVSVSMTEPRVEEPLDPQTCEQMIQVFESRINSVESDSTNQLALSQLVPIPDIDVALRVRHDDSKELEKLGGDWEELQGAFFEDLESGGRTEMDELLTSRKDLHPICQFIAENVFLRILNSSDRSSLAGENYGEIYRNISGLIGSNLWNKEGLIDKRMLLDLMLLKMDRLIPPSVEFSIIAGMSKIVSARTETRLKEEELKQVRMACEEARLKAETEMQVKLIETQTRYLEKLFELDLQERMNSLVYDEAMKHLQVMRERHELADQRSKASLARKRENWIRKKDMMETAQRLRTADIDNLFEKTMKVAGFGLDVAKIFVPGGGVVTAAVNAATADNKK